MRSDLDAVVCRASGGPVIMDVTCSRCGASYEFEESHISTTGMTVKCTQCGHLFKVNQPHAPGPVAVSQEVDRDKTRPDDTKRWQVRDPDGGVRTLNTLSDLTRLIAAGQVTGVDEISRTGQVWRKLGEISELAPFLGGAPPTKRVSDPPAVPTRSTSAAASGVAAETTAEATDGFPPQRLPQRSPAAPRFEVMGTQFELDARESTATSTAKAPPVQARSAARATASGRTATRSVPAPPVASPPIRSEPVDRVSAAAQLAGGSRLWPWLLGLSALLAIGGGFAGAWLVRTSVPASTDSPARAHILRGDLALAAHRPERFAEAVREYAKALAFHPDDPHILSSLSRANAVWSQSLRPLIVPGAVNGSTGTAAHAQEAMRLADQAKLYGEQAAQRNPGNDEASVALSDALRLRGNLVAARAELDRARANAGTPSAETLRVMALLAIAEANGEMHAGRTLVEQAVASEPALIRTRLLLASCLIADRDFSNAHAQLNAVRNLDALHPMIEPLERVLDAATLPPQAIPPPTQPTVPTDDLPVPAANPSVKADAPGVSALELVRTGENALQHGAVQAAERAFARALIAEPGMPRALTGLGYIALERGEPDRALTHFRPAANRGSSDAWLGLGDTYRRLGRMRDALSAYQTYEKRFPGGSRSSIAQRQIELLTEQLQESP